MTASGSRAFERFRCLKEEALRALASGRRGEARAALRRLADVLTQLARESSGNARAARFREAREIREAAGRISGESTPAAKGRESAGSEGEPRFRPRERSPVRFEHIAGLEDVKEEFRLKLVYPFLHPDKAERYRLRRGGGILLYGPPGTGKTLLARAVAGEIDAEFFVVKPSEILSKWVGEAEQNVSRLFEEARSFPVSVIFIDEIDALAPRRGENVSPVMARVVPQILAELEGFEPAEEGTLLFLGATNEPWLLDPAILRPGRFDEKIYVGLPDTAALARMLEIHLERRPVAPGFDHRSVAAELEGYTGADVRELCERAAASAFLESVQGEGERPIEPRDLLSLRERLPPSVPPEAAARYRKYADRAGRGVPASVPKDGAGDRALSEP